MNKILKMNFFSKEMKSFCSFFILFNRVLFIYFSAMEGVADDWDAILNDAFDFKRMFAEDQVNNENSSEMLFLYHEIMPK
jgi:hypothetical protein